MKHKSTYPITISQVLDHPETINKIFLSKTPHKDAAYMGVSMLEYDFSREELGLSFGDKLTLAAIDNDSPSFPLSVIDKNGKLVGKLPFADSIVPKKLMDLGIKVWCYVEAFEIRFDLPVVAVSLYCEKY